MIVVDSSVLIDHLRGIESAQALRFEHAIQAESELILIGDIVLLEVLQGVRDARHAALVERELRQFEMTSMLDSELAISAAAHFRHLRGLGITVRRTMDMIIASFCIAHNHILLHRDRDFELMSRHLGLRTFAALPH